MVILFLGDIFGRPGREAVRRVIPRLREVHRPDIVVANVENIAHGKGVTRETVREVLASGVDACTTGDHVFDARGADDLLSDATMPIVRPGNWPGGVAGRGWTVVEGRGKRLLLMNVLGRVFLRVQGDDPFACVERMLSEASREGVDASLLDVHAEATSEKRAIAEAFDGRISAVVGTHTHVQTNDPQTLPKGTGFLTDAGMCGPSRSVIGLEVPTAVQWIRTQISAPLDPAEGPCAVCGCVARVGRERTTVELVRVEGIEVAREEAGRA